MKINENPVNTLNDPQVRAYFLGILECNLSCEEKYQRFIDFFEKERCIRERILSRFNDSDEVSEEVGENKLARIFSEVGEELGSWDPEKTINQTEDCIKRAVKRLMNSQHRCDEGWGPKIEESDLWGTAYAVLCLGSAKRLPQITFDVDLNFLISKGVKWLINHSQFWSVDQIPPNLGTPVYDLALGIRCFHQVEKVFSQHPTEAVNRCIDRLANSQNIDGGWDAKIWGADVQTQTRVWSEVGATSFALQSLSESGNDNFQEKATKAVEWLIKNQNEDGSWNNGSCRPDSEKLEGTPTITKTCEALQGILAGKAFKIERIEIDDSVEKAVTWLKVMEKPIVDENGTMKGWGWDNSVFSFTDTCLTLETLVRMPGTSLALLSANAKWLMSNQFRKNNHIEDGNWPKGHTARIALSLIEYYKKLRENYS